MIGAIYYVLGTITVVAGAAVGVWSVMRSGRPLSVQELVGALTIPLLIIGSGLGTLAIASALTALWRIERNTSYSADALEKLTQAGSNSR